MYFFCNEAKKKSCRGDCRARVAVLTDRQYMSGDEESVRSGRGGGDQAWVEQSAPRDSGECVRVFISVHIGGVEGMVRGSLHNYY